MPRMALDRLAIVAILLSSLVALPAQSAEAPAKNRVGPFELVSSAPALAVESQGRTGTCWSFATVSFLESEVLRTRGREVDLSEMFAVRHAIVEKAHRYVRLGGVAQFSQGGLSHDIIAMARKYGVVPQAAYDGLVGDNGAHDHSEMFRILKLVVNEFAEGEDRPGEHYLRAIGGIADAYMGAPPRGVDVGGKKFPPQDYARSFLKLDLDGYVELMSYSYAPFHEDAELLVKDNWMRFQGYRNLPIDELMEGFDHALEQGYTLAVDMDVSEPGFDPRKGVAHLSKKLEREGAITQEVRDEMFRDGSTTDDHLMHVVGTAERDGKRYYYTKNSWGKVGPYKGYLFISENFMRAKLLAFMVHESGLPGHSAVGAAR